MKICNGPSKIPVQIDAVVHEVDYGELLQELAERANADILFGCFSARCCVCLVRVLAGKSGLSEMLDLERDTLESIGAAPDERLACQCKIVGPLSIMTQKRAVTR